MKKDNKTDSSVEKDDKTCDLELESVNDIIERIESLSYEGRRHIIAYLKAKMAKSKKE
ncbi:MAG: hypothetical protein PVG39_04825 [Desulfobacteraceae bacterium]|jgi:hypothetical protein